MKFMLKIGRTVYLQAWRRIMGRVGGGREADKIKGFGYVKSHDAGVGQSWKLDDRQLTVDEAGNEPSGTF